jgi:ferrous iron transport protein B
VIIAICIVMWWLSAYPRVGASVGTPEAVQQSTSYAGQIGHALQPAFAPLGYDWQLTVGVLTSFMAREVFVSTMAVLAGASGDADVDSGVIDRIRTMPRDDGTPVFTPATAASALIFFVLAMQCLPTLAVTARESGAAKFAGIQLAYMSGLAYVSALACYQLLRLAGVS